MISIDRNNRIVVQPAGDMTAGSTADVRTELRGAVADGARELVVDFGNVTAIDASGVGVLVAAHNSLASMGGHLEAVGVPHSIAELLRSIGVDEYIKISRREAEA